MYFTQDTFDAKIVTKNLIAWIRDWFADNGPDSPVVLGISGGKDSTVVAKLCAEAIGPDRVIGVLIPDGRQDDIDDSRAIVKELGIKSYELNIKDITTAFGSLLVGANIQFTKQMTQNLPPRIRMSLLYAVAQCFNGRVANTCNLSETFIGWETRWGDSVGDFSPLAKLTASEVVAIGDALGISDCWTKKTPSDGLCGKTDEDKFGFTYASLDRYIRLGQADNIEDELKIYEMHKRSAFKRNPIEFFEPNLPVVETNLLGINLKGNE